MTSSKSKEIAMTYKLLLESLATNDKKLIDRLTIFAKLHIEFAPAIVKAVENHLQKVESERKLLVLYLIDSIVKNISGPYLTLFEENIVTSFCHVFEKVNESTRARMFKLRKTWNEVFQASKLYALDTQVHSIDPGWPVMKPSPTISSGLIHLNPRFLSMSPNQTNGEPPVKVIDEAATLREQLLKKQRELLELKNHKMELKILQAKFSLEQKKKEMKEHESGVQSEMIFKQENYSDVQQGKLEAAVVSSQITNQPAKQNIPAGNLSSISSRDPRMKSKILHQESVITVNTDSRDCANTNENHNDNILLSTSSESCSPSLSAPFSSLNNEKSNTCPKSTSSSPRTLGSKSKSKQPKTSPNKFAKLDHENSPVRSNFCDDINSNDNSLFNNYKQSSTCSNNNSNDSNRKKADNKSDSSSPLLSLNSAGFTEEEQSGSLIVSLSNPQSFKDKHRNYTKRDKDSGSPEHNNVCESDVLGANIIEPSSEKRDVDLRRSPSVNNKRLLEHLDTNPKKSKTEKFDPLLGNKDVDLRVLPQTKVRRPPTPPPPIISGDDISKTSWAKLKSPLQNDRTNQRSEKPRTYGKLSDDLKDRRRAFFNDIESRSNKKNWDLDNFDYNSDRKIAIIIRQAKEQLDEGSISDSDYYKLVRECWKINEDQKLQAALRKEKENHSIVWEKGIDINNFNPKYNNMSQQGLDSSMRNGPRWQPWQQPPSPWVHSQSTPFGHFNPDHQAWQNPGYFQSPMRPGFNQFQGFNPPMNPNGPRMIPPLMGLNIPLIHRHPMPNEPNNVRRNGPAPHYHQSSSLLGPVPSSPSANINSNNSSVRSTVEVNSRQMSESNGNETINRVDVESLPLPDPKLLEEIAKDTMKSIKIDNIPREVRYYGQIGVFFLNWDDPKEIGFQEGSRRIVIDDKETISCSFNDDYKEFTHNGEIHRIKFGAPTRELFIDDKWFECRFDGSPITVDLGNKKMNIKLEGPPPQVRIGNIKRTDLVVAKINMIIDGKSLVSVFLDAKPQVFEINGQPQTLQFIDALETVLINGTPFKVEYGGLPKPITIKGQTHFIRFSVLPKNIRPGFVKIFNMKDNVKRMDTESMTADSTNSEPDSTSQVELNTDKLDISSLNVNIDDLFQRLVEVGIVPKLDAQTEVKSEEKEVEEKPQVTPITFDKPETLKLKPSMASALYSGMQCSSCGARFALELTVQYSQHLDWHFRQNRREKDLAKKPHSRSWYYDASDWIQFEEIDDSEDKAQNWFEFEKQAAETDRLNSAASPSEDIQPSVPVSNDDNARCQVCHDNFEQFFNEETEEWHLRPTVSFEDKNYHPRCLEDYQGSLDKSVFNDSTLEIKEEQMETGEELEAVENVKMEVDENFEGDIKVKVEVVEAPDDTASCEQNPTEEKVLAIDQIKVESLEAGEAVDDDNLSIVADIVESIAVKVEELIDQEDTEEMKAIKSEDVEMKTEPECEEPLVNDAATLADTTLAAVTSSIDGNFELDSAPQVLLSAQSKIKINITKPIVTSKEQDDVKKVAPISDERNESEEQKQVLVPASIKPSFHDKKLKILPPIKRDQDLSGLCSIM